MSDHRDQAVVSSFGSQILLLSTLMGVLFSCSEYDVAEKPSIADGDTEGQVEAEEVAPDIIVSPVAINYGIVYEGNSATDLFRVGNIGDGSLIVDQVSLTTGNQGGHSITLSEPLPWRLEAGEYKDVATSYLSHDANMTYGEVSIVSNDPDETISTVTLVNEPYELPEETLEGCEGVADVELNEELMVWSWDSGPSVGSVWVEMEGTYHVYSNYIAESGSSQTNESAYLRISNAFNSAGLPQISNCNDDWVVTDQDNSTTIPSGMVVYVGTFYLTQGDNTVSFYHYCPLYRAGECPSFHINIDSSSTCDTDNANSVHFTGTAICLLPAE